MNTPEDPVPRKPKFAPNTRFQPESLAGNINIVSIFEGLLKYPGNILHELKSGRSLPVAMALGVLLLFCLLIYGVVVGSLAGGAQLWVAPAKIVLGSVLCSLICLPSLYIFLCLGGADTTLRQVSGELLAAVSLTSLLLIGFAPVAWVFSQSTESAALMAGLHLVFWGVALGFGLRLIGRGGQPHQRSCTRVWILIYVLVCLQMMTALRPIVGSANTILPEKKEFFLAHGWRVFTEGGNRR